MPIHEVYAQRKQRAERGDAPFQYDDIPHILRVQLRQIFDAAIGPYLC